MDLMRVRRLIFEDPLRRALCALRARHYGACCMPHTFCPATGELTYRWSSPEAEELDTKIEASIRSVEQYLLRKVGEAKE